jgi:S-adenosyl-L-methionine hydrolase (adenosine-forming)
VATYDWISFTTDYGEEDGFTAACRGVIARYAPHVRVLDVTHAVPPQDVRRGAAVLAQTVPYLPPAVHLAVVDPGVGTTRRGVALVAAHGVLVGPDNGLLVPAAEALGGVRAAFELTDPEYRLPEVSRTFHGRDVFAPAAAHVASGVPPARLGPALDPDTLVRLPEAVTRLGAGMVDTEVVGVDRFGNVQLDATGGDLDRMNLTVGSPLTVHLADRSLSALRGETFEDVPRDALVVLVDSAGRAAVAVNTGSAASRLRLATGDRVRLAAAGAIGERAW